MAADSETSNVTGAEVEQAVYDAMRKVSRARTCKLCGQRCPDPDNPKRHGIMGERGPEMAFPPPKR